MATVFPALRRAEGAIEETVRRKSPIVLPNHARDKAAGGGGWDVASTLRYDARSRIGEQGPGGRKRERGSKWGGACLSRPWPATSTLPPFSYLKSVPATFFLPVISFDLREKTSCERSVSGLQSLPELEADVMARQSTSCRSLPQGRCSSAPTAIGLFWHFLSDPLFPYDLIVGQVALADRSTGSIRLAPQVLTSGGGVMKVKTSIKAGQSTAAVLD
jgi:hypothetical protein